MTKGKDLQLKQDLLEKATLYALEHGFSDLSLRPLADGIGSSARMLIHHFGSKEALLAQIVERIEAQFLALSDQLLEQGASPPDMLTTLWQAFTQPALEPVLRSIFELWGYALIHPHGFETFLENLVTDWVTRFSSAFEQAGLEPERASTLAHLTVATVEGLLLQRLTGVQELRIQAAFNHLVTWLEHELKSQSGARMNPLP
jgi:AcrR family transcriptional regulator